MTDLAYEDAVDALDQGVVPVLIPLKPTGVHLGFWHPRGNDLDAITSSDRMLRAAFATILIGSLRARTGQDT